MFLVAVYLFGATILKASAAEPVVRTDAYAAHGERVPRQEPAHDDPLHTVHASTPAFWNDSKMTVSASGGIGEVVASWTFEGNSSDFAGFFLLTYRNDKNEHFDSPPLEKTSRQFSLPSLDRELTYTICVHALLNSTEVQHACTVYNENSLKIVVGIMAGVVFLIPCVIAFVWLIRKDKRMTDEDESLLECGKKETSNNVTASVLHDGHRLRCVGYINIGCTNNDHIESFKTDSKTVLAEIESSKTDPSTVNADIETSNSTTVNADIETSKEDPSTVNIDIESKTDSSTVNIDIESKTGSSTVIADIESTDL